MTQPNNLVTSNMTINKYAIICWMHKYFNYMSTCQSWFNFYLCIFFHVFQIFCGSMYFYNWKKSRTHFLNQKIKDSLCQLLNEYLWGNHLPLHTKHVQAQKLPTVPRNHWKFPFKKYTHVDVSWNFLQLVSLL